MLNGHHGMPHVCLHFCPIRFFLAFSSAGPINIWWQISQGIFEIICSQRHLEKKYGSYCSWHYTLGCWWLWIFSCDQAALRTVQSVRLSVCLLHLFHYVPIIVSSWNFQELLPYHWQTWCPCKRSRSEVKGQGHRGKKTSNLTQIGRFRTVTPVWIHQWWWNDEQSWK